MSDQSPVPDFEGVTAQQRAVAGLLVAVLAGGSVTIFVRLSDAPSTAKVFYRLLLAVAMVGPLAVLRYREEFLMLSVRDLTSIGIAGVMLASNLTLFFESLEWTSVAASTTLAQTQLVFVAVGGYLLLGERINRRTIAGIAVALFGVAAMSLSGLVSSGLFVGERPVYGNMLALVASVSFSGYLLTGRSLRQRISLFPYITIVYAASTVAVFGFALLTDATLAPSAYPPHEWVLFLGMAVSTGVITHTMINFALEYLQSSSVSIVMLGYPVVSTIYALVFLGEVPDVITIGGGVVILFGIYITTG